LPVRFSMLAALLFSALALVGCGDGNPAAGGKYTISFDANGGSGTPPESIVAANGSDITLPSGSGLYRSGYNFSGWNTNSSGTGTSYSAGSYYTVSGKATLYAKWTAAAATGTVRVLNSSGSTLTSVTLRLSSGSGSTFSTTGSLGNGSSEHIYNIPAGTYTVTAKRVTGGRDTWTGSVTVTANSTTTVTVTMTGGWS